MVRRIYEPCGRFILEGTRKTAEVQTFLPERPNYQYRYYNISTNDDYGILGVLVHGGQNRNLRSSNEPGQSRRVAPTTIDLINGLNTIIPSRSFHELQQENQIIFICFHDDHFDNDATNILRHYQQNLANFPNIPQYEKVNKGLGDEPKIGDGGILTFNGSCE